MALEQNTYHQNTWLNKSKTLKYRTFNSELTTLGGIDDHEITITQEFTHYNKLTQINTK